MAENYRYRLARWNERDKSLRCPQCGRGRGCFKEYLNEDGTPVDPVNHTCGLCDHTSSCGYHLPPSEYYKMNPEERDNYRPQAIERKPKKRIEIDIELANRSRAGYEKNTFVKWVISLPWTDEQAERLYLALQFYNVGTSKDGGVIWWQIDEDMKVRTGKKMLYNPETGKRLKDNEGNSIGFNWIHSIMKFGDDYELVQCLFGEHLLKCFPDATVCVVESEKTALLMSAFDRDAFDKHIWLATGGKYNLSESKLYPLRKRNVLLYPDKDAVEDWRERIKDIPYNNLKLYDKWTQTIWQPEDGEKADIGDSILRMINPPPLPDLETLMKDNEWLRQLDEALGLELVDIEKL